MQTLEEEPAGLGPTLTWLPTAAPGKSLQSMLGAAPASVLEPALPSQGMCRCTRYESGAARWLRLPLRPSGNLARLELAHHDKWLLIPLMASGHWLGTSLLPSWQLQMAHMAWCVRPQKGQAPGAQMATGVVWPDEAPCRHGSPGPSPPPCPSALAGSRARSGAPRPQRSLAELSPDPRHETRSCFQHGTRSFLFPRVAFLTWGGSSAARDPGSPGRPQPCQDQHGAASSPTQATSSALSAGNPTPAQPRAKAAHRVRLTAHPPGGPGLCRTAAPPALVKCGPQRHHSPAGDQHVCLRQPVWTLPGATVTNRTESPHLGQDHW